jgi:hypothetical protein
MNLSLNRNASFITGPLLSYVEGYRLAVDPIEGRGRCVDCVIETWGGLRMGIELARICLSGLAPVTFVPPGWMERPFRGSRRRAAAAGLHAARLNRESPALVTSGNYGGKLGPFHIRLHDILSRYPATV